MVPGAEYWVQAPRRDQLVINSPHPSDNASPSDRESLGPKVPGLSSQSVASRQAELGGVFPRLLA